MRLLGSLQRGEAGGQCVGVPSASTVAYDGRLRFPSQQASHRAEGCCPGGGCGGRAWRRAGGLNRWHRDSVILEDTPLAVLASEVGAHPG